MASSRVGTRIRARTPGTWLRDQLLHHGKQERESLSGAGLGCCQNVFAFQRMRDGHFLDRGAGGELCYRQFLLEPSREGHFFKLCQSIFTFLGGATRACA